MRARYRDNDWEDEVDLFELVAQRYLGDASKGELTELERILGTDEYTVWAKVNSNLETPMTPELRRKIDMLLGPYGEVFFKLFKEQACISKIADSKN